MDKMERVQRCMARIVKGPKWLNELERFTLEKRKQKQHDINFQIFQQLSSLRVALLNSSGFCLK